MAKIKDKLKLIKLRLRPSPRSTKIMLIVAILFAMMALIALRMAITDLDNRAEDLRKKAAAMEQENKDLQGRLQPTRLLHPWDFPGKSTGVWCHCCEET